MADNRNEYDVVIIGAGVAGMRAAVQCVQNKLSYKIIEANDYLGGRVRSQVIDLTQYKEQYPHLPDQYIFEHGAAWVHGVDGNPLYEIFDDLYKKYEPTQKFADQLSAMFEGNVWYMPEFSKYELFTLVDSATHRELTKEEYDKYIAIVCIHLRQIMRQFNGLKLSTFAHIYVKWVAETLHGFEVTKDCADVLARAVAWYFHSVEAYSGTPIGVMSASDIFVAQDTAEPLEDDVEYDIMNDILKSTSQQQLLELMSTASNIDINKMITEYLQTPHAKGDAALQACYLSNHSTLKCGMGKLIDLFQKDIEHCSGTSINVDLNTKVTSVDFPSRTDDQVVDNVIIVNESSKNDDCAISKITNNNNNNSNNNTITSTNQYNAIVSAIKNGTTDEIKYYARYAVVCTASIYSLLKTIKFPEDKPELQTVKDDLNRTSSPAFFKKIAYCFPEVWWTHKPDTRIMAITQSEIDFNKQSCQHQHCIANIQALKENDYVNVDMSQGGYPCIIEMAKQHKNDYDIPFCNVNMIWDCNEYNKNVPVLIAALVGNFAEQAEALTEDVVYKIVWKQLQQVYQSVVKYQHETLGNTHFPTTIPTPLWSLMTNWAQNPTILQAYTLINDCQFSTQERITLASKHHIFCAGEAMNLDHSGSVHGAMYSADYAIEQIVDKYINKKTTTENKDQ